MANEGSRRIWMIAFRNFINSFRPRQIQGNYMGEDYLGNKYYEIPANPSKGKRKTSRWFEPAEKTDIDHGHELTAEWESWLRGRR
jgi:NADH:ubiquinone oxidoreductase subunit